MPRWRITPPPPGESWDVDADTLSVDAFARQETVDTVTARAVGVLEIAGRRVPPYATISVVPGD